MKDLLCRRVTVIVICRLWVNRVTGRKGCDQLCERTNIKSLRRGICQSASLGKLQLEWVGGGRGRYSIQAWLGVHHYFKHANTHTPVVLKTPKHVRLHFWHDCLRLGADSGQENPCCVGKQRTHAGRRSAHILLNRTTPRANYPQKMREDGGGGWGASDEHGNTNLICPLFGHPSTPLINCKCTNRKQLLGSQIKRKQGNYTSFRPASLSPPLHSSMRE